MALYKKNQMKWRKYDSMINQLTFDIDGWMINGGDMKSDQCMASVFVVLLLTDY
jgi:hypothetical protein